jgi:predicted nucleic acid-binding protein
VGIRYLLDTNVISETRRTEPDRRVLRFLDRAPSASLYLSVLTLGEVRKGVVLLIPTEPEAARRLANWLDGLEYSFSEHIMPVDAGSARIWGELSGQRTRPVIDTVLAATALHHDMTMVTRNTSHFADTGVKLLDPWEE